MLTLAYFPCALLDLLSFERHLHSDEVLAAQNFRDEGLLNPLPMLLAYHAFAVIGCLLDKRLSHILDQLLPITALDRSVCISEQLGACDMAVFSGVSKWGFAFLVSSGHELPGLLQDVLKNL